MPSARGGKGVRTAQGKKERKFSFGVVKRKSAMLRACVFERGKKNLRGWWWGGVSENKKRNGKKKILVLASSRLVSFYLYLWGSKDARDSVSARGRGVCVCACVCVCVFCVVLPRIKKNAFVVF